jgi:hypothetical protein
MPDLVPSPLTSAVEALIEQSHANGDRITLTDVASYLGLDIQSWSPMRSTNPSSTMT